MAVDGPACFILRAHRLPDFFRQVVRQALAGCSHQHKAKSFGLRSGIGEFRFRRRGAGVVAAEQVGGARQIGAAQIAAEGEGVVGTVVSFGKFDPRAHGQKRAQRCLTVGAAFHLRHIVLRLVLDGADLALLDGDPHQHRHHGLHHRVGQQAVGVAASVLIAFEQDRRIPDDQQSRRRMPRQVLVDGAALAVEVIGPGRAIAVAGKRRRLSGRKHRVSRKQFVEIAERRDHVVRLRPVGDGAERIVLGGAISLGIRPGTGERWLAGRLRGSCRATGQQRANTRRRTQRIQGG